MIERTALGRLARLRSPRAWLGLPLQILSVVVVLGVWQAIASGLDPILLPTPAAIIASLVELTRQGVLVQAVGTSLLDLVTGFAIALLIGVVAGTLMGRYRVVEQLLNPYVSFFNATPMVALMPVVIIWFGLSFWSRVFFVFILAVWSVLVNTVEGIKNVDRGLMEVGTSFGLSETQVVRTISFPGALPYVLAGVRVGMGKAIIGMVIGEYSIQLAGLGGLAQNYGDAFQTGKLLAVIACTSLFGVVSVVALHFVQARLFPWIAGVAGER